MSTPTVETPPDAQRAPAGWPTGVAADPANRTEVAGTPAWGAPPDSNGAGGAAPPAGPGTRGGARGLLRRLTGPLGVTLIVAASLSAIAFVAGGGLELESMTAVEMALTIGSSVVVAGAILALASGAAGAPGKHYGAWPALLTVAFAALTALSVAWSVAPDASWQDAGRMFAYAGVFVGAVTLAHIAPQRWSAVLGGLTLAAVVVSGYALLTKVFPGQLDAADTYSRLQQPYGYWIATGLGAAMGAIGCLWLGARRDGHALLRALAYPAMGLELTTLLLTYSRGPVVALGVGLVVWFAIVPLRLRGAAVLLSGAVGAVGVVVFDFTTHALSSENVPLAERSHAGGQLGVLLAVMLLVLTAAGLAIGFLTARRAPRPKLRRRAGAALLGALAAALVLLVGALAASQRGLVGTISHDWNTLTNPNAAVPANTPGRLTAIASVRARYWDEALKIFSAHPAVGAGADGYATARLRYRTDTLDVMHAHGFVVQTLADLGLCGLILALALFGSWVVAARRPTRPLRRDLPYTPERIGLLSMLALVVVFGTHSLIDWTWYVPGNACVALLCAGWLAGRGPLREANPSIDTGSHTTQPHTSAARPRTGWRAALAFPYGALAGAVLLAALIAAYSQWQPQRSVESSQRALALVTSSPTEARRAAQDAIDEDPLSANALSALAAIQAHMGEHAAAENTLRRAVRLQPSNPQTWAALGEFDLESGDYQAAVRELRAAVYLNPESIAEESAIAANQGLLRLRNAYLQALRATSSS